MAPGLAAAVVVAGLFVPDPGRAHRIALAAGSTAAAIAAACVTADGTSVPPDSVMVLLPALLLLLASSAQALGGLASWSLALALAAIAAWGVAFQPEPERPAVRVLDHIRSVALPGTALVAAGEDRVAIAVHARLGRSVPTPTLYVPEHATPETLAALCRRLRIREIWLHAPGLGPFPGFVAADSRPAGAPDLSHLVVEGS